MSHPGTPGGPDSEHSEQPPTKRIRTEDTPQRDSWPPIASPLPYEQIIQVDYEPSEVDYQLNPPTQNTELSLANQDFLTTPPRNIVPHSAPRQPDVEHVVHKLHDVTSLMHYWGLTLTPSKDPNVKPKLNLWPYDTWARRTPWEKGQTFLLNKHTTNAVNANQVKAQTLYNVAFEVYSEWYPGAQYIALNYLARRKVGLEENDPSFRSITPDQFRRELTKNRSEPPPFSNWITEIHSDPYLFQISPHTPNPDRKPQSRIRNPLSHWMIL